MTSTTFTLNGTGAQVSPLVLGAFKKEGFRISVAEYGKSIAERGSITKNFFVGMLAQYYKVGFSIDVVDDAITRVQVTQLSSGLMGGLVGMMRTRKELARLCSVLQEAFVSGGFLVATSER